jgi:2-oxoglutarate dehydrogenase complex dehydrogenase (E1) component-like enzyme
LIVALNSLISEASKNDDQSIEQVVLSMPHRGRLATLVVLNDYPMQNLLYKIAGNNDIPE